MEKIKKEPGGRKRTRRDAAAVIAVAFGAIGSAQAFQIDSGNDDVSIRWDNTVRYNWAQRVQAPNNKLLNDPIADDGDSSFAKNKTVASRFDVLSEMDFVYKKDSGFRVSAALWDDAAYGNTAKNNSAMTMGAAVAGVNPALAPLAPAINAYFPNGGQFASYDRNTYSSYTKRFYAGPSGEFLDAFAFAKFNIGDMSGSVKLGRHTVYWGESLLLGGALNGVSYSQSPIDLQKGFATPGAEAKELFRPLNNLSATLQVNERVSLAAQYFLQWEPYRYPEGGTYLGPVDFAFNGPDRQLYPIIPTGVPGPLNPIVLANLARGDALTPKNSGEWGLAAYMNPQWLDGKIGLYYRRYSDKLPQAFISSLTPGAMPVVTAATFGTILGAQGTYNLYYGSKVDLYGISLAKSVAGISVGAELSYRHNTPLNSQTLGMVTAATPVANGTPGARGDTTHALINAIGLMSKTPLFDAASWAAELTWSRWNRVTSGESLFFAEGHAACNGLDKWDGCSTKDAVGLGLIFTPTWYQAFPSIDLSMPISYSEGLRGNSALAFGGNERLGNYTVGLRADVEQKYQIDLQYTSYFGATKENANAITSQNGFTALLKDRGFLSLTLKTSF